MIPAYGPAKKPVEPKGKVVMLLEPVLLSRPMAARVLGVSLSTVDSLVADGLPSVRIGGRRMFRPDDLKAWAAGLQTATHQENE